VGARIAGELGVPVWFYGQASVPPGRGLAELRRGGFEALLRAIPPERAPDLVPPGDARARLHPTAGGVCVGARPVLLAWNVDVEDVAFPDLVALASRLRASGGGVEGLRVLALDLPRQGRRQLSMNLEDAASRDPFAVFRHLEDEVGKAGGRVVRTEIIGLAPDALVTSAAADRLRTLDRTPPPALSSLLGRHLSGRAARAARRAVEVLLASGEPLPGAVHEALDVLERELLNPPHREPKE
jgi:glutamate formiminotransferase